jgi:hypothetical protein
MKVIYVSNYGDDENDGLSRETPVKSRKRTLTLCDGDTEMYMMEGAYTLNRLIEDIETETLEPRDGEMSK